MVVVSAVALSEKVPDPALRPHGFTLRVGELLDLDETASDLVAAGYERVDQVEDRGQFAVRGGLLDVYPATEERAIRVDLFDDEIESLRWFSTFTQRSLGDTERRRDRARRRARRRAPRARRDRRARAAPTSARTSPSCCPLDDFRDLLDLLPDEAELIIAADEDTEPALRDHWDDVCAAFHDTDAHHLYVKPDGILAAARGAPAAAAVLDLRLAAARVPRPGRRVRRPQPARGRAGAGEARPLRATRRSSRGRTAAAASAPPTTSRASRRAGTGPSEGLVFQEANLRDGFVAPGIRLAVDPRAPADPPPQGLDPADAPRPRAAAQLHRPAHGRLHRPRGPRRRALRRLRHEDRRRHHARLPEPRVPGRRQGLHAGRPAGEDQPLRRRRRQRAVALQARRQALGHDQGARPPRRAGAGRRAAQPLRRAQAPARLRVRARLGLAARVRGRVPVPRDARPARGDRGGQGRHGVRAPDGPADLRRRRLRQDRGRAARRVQVGERRQAGADARADDDPRPAALRHVRRAAARLPVHDRARQPLPPRRRAARRGQALRRGQGRHPDRHPPRALAATCARRTSG